jgi:hypothetical protein
MVLIHTYFIDSTAEICEVKKSIITACTLAQPEYLDCSRTQKCTASTSPLPSEQNFAPASRSLARLAENPADGERKHAQPAVLMLAAAVENKKKNGFQADGPHE